MAPRLSFPEGRARCAVGSKMKHFGWSWAHLAHCQERGRERRPWASAVPSLTWRGCQVHTGGRIRGQAAVGARLGHRMLNRGTYWSGLGAQPALLTLLPSGRRTGSGFGGWGPSALGAAERDGGVTPGSRAAGRRLLPSAWRSLARGVALLTSTRDTCSHPLRSMAHHECTMDQDDHGENGPG